MSRRIPSIPALSEGGKADVSDERAVLYWAAQDTGDLHRQA